MPFARHSRELDMNRGACKKCPRELFFFPAEVISRCRALPCFPQTCPICQNQPLILLFSLFFFIFLPLSNPDIVHENLKMGSDGESDQASGTSSDEVQSPTGVCLRNRGNRRISAEVGFASLCCHGASIAFLLFSFKGGK